MRFMTTALSAAAFALAGATALTPTAVLAEGAGYEAKKSGEAKEPLRSPDAKVQGGQVDLPGRDSEREPVPGRDAPDAVVTGGQLDHPGQDSEREPVPGRDAPDATVKGGEANIPGQDTSREYVPGRTPPGERPPSR